MLDGLLPDLNVIGCTVDDARERVEKHLDRALLQEQRHIKIIHGHGTGQLRRSIADLLEHHPQVDTFTLAPREQGGEGATLAELKDD
jgi:DNA mismatch repair protein MutS2